MNRKRFTALLFLLSLVIGAVLTGGCAGARTTAPAVEGRFIKDVTAREAFTLIQENRNNPDFVILDVRTPEEFAEGHLEKAVNMNFYSESFRNELKALDRNKTYLLHCHSGNRSSNTLKIMRELNFRKIYHMTGGTIEWEEEGLPMVK